MSRNNRLQIITGHKLDRTNDESSDKFHDECAVVGVIGNAEAANYCYLGLYAMQHRGQEGAGIVSTNGTEMRAYRDMGLVADVFDEDRLSMLSGTAAIGHARYATFGGKDWENLQPFSANFGENSFAIAHNGNLINADKLRSELEQKGAIFSTTSDSEVILHLIAHATDQDTIPKKLEAAFQRLRGAFSLVVLGLHRLIAVRDAYGVRPLSLGKIGDGYIVASETCAFDLIGAQFVRDIEPGEMLEITADGKLTSYKPLTNKNNNPAFCVFEYIYFARPDSTIDGLNVYKVRKALGAELAKEHPIDADIVIPVPDSGVPAAIGYAEHSGIPMEFGLIRNHYVGRTFIEPQQSIRNFGVKIKLNANRDVLDGKRVIVVDDSIVRGTTSKKIVTMLRNAGAKEIHFRVSSPPTTGPCYYGIDTPSREELIASTHDIEGIRSYINVDTLAYLSEEGIYRAVGKSQKGYCDACFTGNYRLGELMSCVSNVKVGSIGNGHGRK
ncbi:MAG: amidophosphoribosyltransferase [Bdellovibrionales bacterium]|nr:amidophosphoribosyltransferase [Bdellovibrionales bacterium]